MSSNPIPSISMKPDQDFSLKADYGDLIKSGEDPNDPKVMEVMIQRCVDLLSDIEGDEDIKPYPSKPSTEGYAMDCIGYGPGGLYWPPDFPLKHTEEYDENIAEIFSNLIDSKLHG